MTLLHRFRAIPVSYRVPILVAALMLVISGVISERVLGRLSQTQENFLNGLADTYLDGLASALTPAVLRDDVWEVFDTLDRSSSYKALGPIETVVTGADGRVLAASDPRRVPTYSDFSAANRDHYAQGTVTIDGSALQGFARRDLFYQGQPIGTIYATFDVAHLFAERREVLTTLLVTNGVLALLFSLSGFWLVRRMIRPMRVLEDHMRVAAQGIAEPISPRQIPAGDIEVARLYHRYNTLVQAERERANFALQLAEEEKLSSLGRLASGMAHEINNPLGGLFNAIDTLKHHGNTTGVRETSIRLIERGLAGIRDVVEAALATYRPERATRPLTVEDFEDVRLLVSPEIRRRRQTLNWDVLWQSNHELPIKGPPVRQAVLNLLLNASAATPEGGKVTLQATPADDRFTISISDEGPGIPPDIAGILLDRDPGPAVRAGQGLGLWMVRRVVEDLGGTIKIRKCPGGGTTITLLLSLEQREREANAA